MKKSRLLKIIRESVKETLIEQYTPTSTVQHVQICNCSNFHRYAASLPGNSQGQIAPHCTPSQGNGNLGGWTFNIDLVSIGSSGPLGIGPVGVVAPTVGNVFCHMYGINGPQGITNTGDPSDCLDANGNPSARRIALKIQGSYNANSGNALRALLPSTIPCGLGCTDPLYDNYDPLASHDDGSCTGLLGCTDPAANNYDPTAQVDDGTCNYTDNAHNTFTFEICDANDPQYIGTIVDETTSIIPAFFTGFQCNNNMCNTQNLNQSFDLDLIYPATGFIGKLSTLGNTVYSTNIQSISNTPCPPILGCTDPQATNYNPNATQDDGSCIYPVYGCTDPTATNYNANATIDDGSCYYEGCTDPNANNYDPTATVDSGNCYGCMDSLALNYCPLCNIDCSANVGSTNDDSCCNYTPIPGCMDPSACNYDPAATVGNNTCDYTCYGCTNPLALNFDPTATIDDGSCIYPEEGCADPSAVQCSQQPGILQNLSNCYDPNHYGCNNDPTDTSCCLYESRDRDVTPGCTPPPGGCPPGHLWNPYPHCQCLRMSIDPRGDIDHLSNDDRGPIDCTSLPLPNAIPSDYYGCWICKSALENLHAGTNAGPCQQLGPLSAPYYSTPQAGHNYYNTQADCFAALDGCMKDPGAPIPDDPTTLGEGLIKRFQKLANLKK